MSLDSTTFYKPIEFLKDFGKTPYDKNGARDKETKEKGRDAVTAFNKVGLEIKNRANLPLTAEEIQESNNAYIDQSGKKFCDYFWFIIRTAINKDYAVNVSIFADKAIPTDDSFICGYYRVEIDFHNDIFGNHIDANIEYENRLNRLGCQIVDDLYSKLGLDLNSKYRAVLYETVKIQKDDAVKKALEEKINNGTIKAQCFFNPADEESKTFTSKPQVEVVFPVLGVENCTDKLIDILADSVRECFACLQKYIYVYNSYIESQLQELILKNNKQIVLTGAPGTGKTFSAREFAEVDLGRQYEELDAGVKSSISKADWISERWQMVQFHPSYDYTDFVEGLRPVQDGETTTFKRMDGTFKAFCRKVENEKCTGNRYFIIDEINRADLSKVFGELMYCLEKNYRGEKHKIPTQYKNLPAYEIEPDKNTVKPIEPDCYKDGFYIPENIVIIGTMNDIDRSVDTFDYALRRRFKWINVEVNKVLLISTFDQMCEHHKAEYSISSDDLNRYVAQICEMNSVLAKPEYSRIFKSPQDYYVGPSYFEELLAGKQLTEIWENSVKPLLKEYVRGRDLAEEFLDECGCSLLSGTSEATYALMKKSKKVNLSCKNWSEEIRASKISLVMSLLKVVDKHIEIFNKASVSNLYNADKLLCTRSGEEGKFNALFKDDNKWADTVLKLYQKAYVKTADDDSRNRFVTDWKKAIEEWNEENQ